MFTTALPSPDRRRRPAAFMLALGINGSIFAGLLSIQQTEAALPAPEQVEAYYEIMVPIAMPQAAPGPAPAARGGSGSNARPTPVAPTPLVTPQALPDATLLPMVAAQPEPTGAASIGETGPEGPGGPGQGGPGGPGPGGAGGGGGQALREMPSDVLKVRSQVSPEFPRAAHALGINEATCTVHLAVDGRGRPSAAEVTGCPEMFAAPAQEAAMKWRFAPLYNGAEAVSAHFRINFRFRYAP